MSVLVLGLLELIGIAVGGAIVVLIVIAIIIAVIVLRCKKRFHFFLSS